MAALDKNVPVRTLNKRTVDCPIIEKLVEIDMNGTEIDVKTTEISMISAEIDAKSTEIDMESAEIDAKGTEIYMKAHRKKMWKT